MNILSNNGSKIDLTSQSIRIEGQILPIGAVLTVNHQFEVGSTPKGKNVECSYSFMLGRNATVRRYVVSGEGFEIESQLKTVKKAEAAYERGIDKGHLSTMLTREEDGITTLSLGQLRKGDKITLALEIVQGLERTDKGLRFSFPLHIADSYTMRGTGDLSTAPGSLLKRLSTLPWIDPGGKQNSLSIKIDVMGAVKSVESPNFDIKTIERGDRTTVKFGRKQKKDVVLDVTYKEKEPVLYVDPDYSRWLLTAPSTFFMKKGDTERDPLNVTFLLDRSGSMSHRLNSAKAGLMACISALRPRDQFNVVAFESRHTSTPWLKGNNQGKEAARTYLSGVYACGGTELATALASAIQNLPRKGGTVILITDGEVFNTASVTAALAGTKHRVFVLGIGDASQDRFLSQLAETTGGICKMLNPSEDSAKAALALFNASSRTLWEKATVGDKKIGRAFLGTPVDVWGKDAEPMGLAPSFEFKSKKDSWLVQSPKQIVTPEGLLMVLKTNAKIMKLEAEFEAGDSRVARKLKDLSKLAGLPSREMALVAIVKRKGDKPREMVQEIKASVKNQVFGTASPAGVFYVQQSGAKGLMTNTTDSSVTNYCVTEISCGSSDRDLRSMPNTVLTVGALGPDLSVDYESFGTHTEAPGIGIANVSGISKLNMGTPSIIERLGFLMDDGGLPGATLASRLDVTLELIKDVLEADDPDYADHLKLMIAFVLANAKEERHLHHPVMVEAAV